jgi:hypothetical protein
MSSDRPNLIGDPIRIRGNETRAEWSIILKKPDSTILESSGGTRITVGELKKVMTQGRPLSPAKTQSAPTPVKR